MADTTQGSQDAVDFLLEQHEEIRRLFASVRGATGESGRDAFQCLVRLLAVHETAEEMAVHPAARAADGGDAVVEERLAEESAAKQALADLEKLELGSAEFLAQLDVVEQAVLAHAEQEEQVEFPLLRELHDDATLERMKAAVQVAEATAPTHPHPHGPESAIGNLVVGPFVAIADRVRDALKGR